MITTKAHLGCGFLSKLARVPALFVFFLIPFLGGNDLPLFYVNIDRFWIESGFSVGLIISVMVLFLRGKQNSDDFMSFSKFFLPFLAVTTISLFYTWNRFGTLNSLNTLVWAAGCVYIYLHSDRRDTLLRSLVFGAFMLSVSAIVQHTILFPRLLDTFTQGRYAEIMREQGGIPFASYLYHNMLGGYLAFVFPLAVYFVLARLFRGGALYGLCASVIIVGIILSSSRISMGLSLLALIGAGIVLIWKAQWQGILRLTGVIVLASGITFLLLYSGTGQKEVTAGRAIQEKVQSAYAQLSTINTRTDIWKNGIRVFQKHPMIGYGAGAFEYAYRRYFDGNSYTRVAHSTLLKIGVELGIIGLCTFGLFLAGLFFRTRGVTRDPSSPFLLMSIGAGFLFGLLDFSFDVPSHVVTFFVLSSAFFAPRLSSHGSVVSLELGFPGEKKASLVRGGSIVVFLIMVAGLILSFGFSARANLFKKTMDTGILLEENRVLAEALTAYEEGITLLPFDGEGYIRTVNTLIALHQRAADRNSKENTEIELKKYLGKMVTIGDKDSELFYTMGKGYLIIGERQKAVDYFSKALSYYPSSAYHIYEIASYYVSIDELTHAERLIRSFDPYIEMYRTPHNPRGLFVYKIRDLDAVVAYKSGNTQRAYDIANTNYADALKSAFVITSVKSRQFVSKEVVLKYLEERVNFYEMELKKGRAGPAS